MTRRLLATLLLACGSGCGSDGPVAPLPCTITVGERCWVRLGPTGTRVWSVAAIGADVWIGTEGEGVQRYDAPANAWSTIAFDDKTVQSIEPSPSGDRVWTSVHGPTGNDTTRSYAYLTQDGGGSWQTRDGGLAANWGFYGIAGPVALSTVDPQHVLLVIGRGAAVTRDAGVTWRQTVGISDPSSASTLVYRSAILSRADGERAWLGGGNLVTAEQFLLRSDDGGDTWVEVTPPGGPQFGMVAAMLTDPLDVDKLLASVTGSVHLTRDGARTWETAFEQPGNGYVFGFAQSDTLVVAVSSEWTEEVTEMLGLYVAPDTDGPWTALPTPEAAGGGLDVAFDAGGQLVIATTSGVWLVRAATSD